MSKLDLFFNDGGNVLFVVIISIALAVVATVALSANRSVGEIPFHEECDFRKFRVENEKFTGWRVPKENFAACLAHLNS